jgi:ABC-2 type transport system permease protein
MRKIWVVVQREFLSRVRTKWFVVSTVLGPVVMAAFVFLPMSMASGGGRERSIAVLDATTTGFGARVTDMLNMRAPITATRMELGLDQLEHVADSLATAVGLKELDGFLIVTDQTVADGRAEYRGSNAAAQLDMEIMERFMAQALLAERLSDLGVDPEKVTPAHSNHTRWRGDRTIGQDNVHHGLRDVVLALRSDPALWCAAPGSSGGGEDHAHR